MKQWMIGLCLLSLFISVKSFAYTRPEWVVEKWWDYNTDWEAKFNGDLPALIMMKELNCRHAVTGIAMKTLSHGPQTPFQVYIIEFSGLLYGEGEMHVEGGPFPFDLAVNLSDTAVSGEIWVDTATLDLVYWSRQFSTEIIGRFNGGWTTVGSMDLDVTMEWNPPRALFNFPFNVGDEWTDSPRKYWSGDYRIMFDALGVTKDEEQHFDENALLNMTVDATGVETVNGFNSVRIEYDHIWGDTGKSWYAPLPAWISKAQFIGSSDDSVFTIGYWEMNLDEWGDTAATPQPTRTPVPKTQTPTPRPPTAVPPTFTGTPPTPTPSATLPPWVPRTPTPTPDGQSTFTPTPPMDRPSIRIQSNQILYHANDEFVLKTTLTNPLNAIMVNEYILLEYAEMYWFYPDWSSEIASQFRIIPAESQFEDEEILRFTWPEIDQPLQEFIFWALLTAPGDFEIVGEFDNCRFKFE